MPRSLRPTRRFSPCMARTHPQRCRCNIITPSESPHRRWLLLCMALLVSSCSAQQTDGACDAPVGTAAINTDGSRNVTLLWTSVPNASAGPPYPTLSCTHTVACADFSADGSLYVRKVSLVNRANFSIVNMNVSFRNVATGLVYYSASGFLQSEGQFTKVPPGGEAIVTTSAMDAATFLGHLFTSANPPRMYDATLEVVMACGDARIVRDPCVEQDPSVMATVSAELQPSNATAPRPPPSAIASMLLVDPPTPFVSSTNVTAVLPSRAVNNETDVAVVIRIVLHWNAGDPAFQFRFASRSILFGAPNVSTTFANDSAWFLQLAPGSAAKDGSLLLTFVVTRGDGCGAYRRTFTVELPSSPSTQPEGDSIATLDGVGKATATVMGVTTAMAILGGSGTAAAKSSSVATVRRLLVCQSSDEPTNSLLGFGFGTPDRYYMRGAVVGNTAILVLVSAVLFCIAFAVAVTHNSGLPSTTVFALVTELMHVPSIVFPAAVAIMQPTAGAAMTLVVGGAASDVALGVAWLLSASVLYVYAAYVVIFRFDCALGSNPLPLHRPSWLHEESAAWGWATLWFSPRFRWTALREKSWKRRHMFLFFESKHRWYPALNELMVTGFLGIVAGVAVDDQGFCMSQIVVLLVTSVVQLGMGIWFRPSVNLFDEVYLHGINVLSLVIIVLLMVAFATARDDDDAPLSVLTNYLLLAFTFASMLKVVVDFVGVLIAARGILKRIQALFVSKVALIVHNGGAEPLLLDEAEEGLLQRVTLGSSPSLELVALDASLSEHAASETRSVCAAAAAAEVGSDVASLRLSFPRSPNLSATDASDIIAPSDPAALFETDVAMDSILIQQHTGKPKRNNAAPTLWRHVGLTPEEGGSEQRAHNWGEATYEA